MLSRSSWHSLRCGAAALTIACGRLRKFDEFAYGGCFPLNSQLNRNQIPTNLQSGRLRVSEDCPSVLVRLMDGPRQGQVEVPAGSGPSGLRDLRMPGYMSELGPKYLQKMRKEQKNKTYAKVGSEIYRFRLQFYNNANGEV